MVTLVLGLGVQGRAQAQVFQTDAANTPLPQPVGQAELDLVTFSFAYASGTQVSFDQNGNDVSSQGLSFGDFYPNFEDGDAITLQGLFKWRGEDIDPVLDARTAPGYFTPGCDFTAELVLLGGNCQVALGWYNVTDAASTTPPAASEVYEIVPAATNEYMNCQPPLEAGGFCPLAWDNVDPRSLNVERWTPRAFSSGAILADPRYLGGDIAFAMIGNATGSCVESKYSLYGQNQKNQSGQAWVTALIYPSTVDPGGFYLAFEDLPMSPSDWHSTGVPGNLGMNDGDFNDMVYFISSGQCGVDTTTTTTTSSTTTSAGASTTGEAGASATSSGGAGSVTTGADATGDLTSGGGTASANTSDGGTTQTSASADGGSTATTSSGAEAGATSFSCESGELAPCTCADGSISAQECLDGVYAQCNCGSQASDDGGCGCRLETLAGGAKSPVKPAALLALLLTGVFTRRRWRCSRLA